MQWHTSNPSGVLGRHGAGHISSSSCVTLSSLLQHSSCIPSTRIPRYSNTSLLSATSQQARWRKLAQCSLAAAQSSFVSLRTAPQVSSTSQASHALLLLFTALPHRHRARMLSPGSTGHESRTTTVHGVGSTTRPVKTRRAPASLRSWWRHRSSRPVALGPAYGRDGITPDRRICLSLP